MTEFRSDQFDWEDSEAAFFVGGWTDEERDSFKRRVEELWREEHPETA